MTPHEFAGWRLCANAECAKEWGLMPPHEFARDPRGALCSVCAGKTRRPCTNCGREVITRRVTREPMCHPCRRVRLGLPRAGTDRRTYWREWARANRAQQAAEV